MPETSFIYPSHPNFEPYLEIAETSELRVTVDRDSRIGNSACRNVVVEYDRVDVPYALAFGHRDWNFSNAPDWTLKEGAAAAYFWEKNGGIDTLSSYKLWPAAYVNKGQRIMSPLSLFEGRTPQANEIIAHGVGTLRPRRGKHDGFRTFLGDIATRVDSRFVARTGTYIVDIDVSRNGAWTTAPAALESTNLVMPEVLGELRQLQARRSETGFIDAYLRDLQETFRPMPVFPKVGSETAPQCIFDIRRSWRMAHQNHLRTGLWWELPRDSGELLDRVDELVDRIVIDTNPIETTNLN